MKESIFNENAGRFLKTTEANLLKEAYRHGRLVCGQKEDEYTRSEFFGLAKVSQLLKQPGCVGIRIHYASRWEDENGKPTEVGQGQFKPRVLLTGVDARGKDLPGQVDTDGLKDDGEGGDMMVGDGWTCPKQCAV